MSTRVPKGSRLTTQLSMPPGETEGEAANWNSVFGTGIFTHKSPWASPRSGFYQEDYLL